MNAKRRFLPTHSTLVAYIALFVALGGTAYAVGLPNASVGTKQLKNGAVIAKKLHNGSITPAKLAKSTLRETGSEALENTSMTSTEGKITVATAAGLGTLSASWCPPGMNCGGAPLLSYKNDSDGKQIATISPDANSPQVSAELNPGASITELAPFGACPQPPGVITRREVDVSQTTGTPAAVAFDVAETYTCSGANFYTRIETVK